MKQENDDFKELFRSRLGETGLTVKEGLWEELEKEIPPSRRFFITNFNPIRFTATAAVLLLLVGTYAAFLLLSPQKEMEEAFQQVALVTTSTQEVIHNDRVAEEFAPTVTVPVTLRQSNIIPVIATEEEIDSVSFNFSFSFSMTVEEPSEYRSGNDFWYALTGDDEELAGSNGYVNEQVRENVGKQKASGSKGWSVKVAANAFSPGYSSSLSGARMFTKSNSSLNVVKEWDGNFASSGDFGSNTAYERYWNVVEANEGKGRATKIKHKLPVSVGLLVHKQLNNRWGIQTGVTYTGLRSELSYGEGTYYAQDQKLHYLGIPVKADVTVYEKESWSLYATAGALLEKCITGKIRTTYFEEGLPVLKEDTSLHPGGLNYSLTAAAGVEYKLNDRLALYAEPGLSYSFDDNGTIATLRKDKPLNFNLQCGVRILY